MDEIVKVAIVFALILVFISVLSVIVGWKFEKLLSTLKVVIRLEVTSPPGRVSLLTNFLIFILFLVLSVFHEAMALVKALVKSELELSSFNLVSGFTIVAMMFLANLIVLAVLYGKRQ